MISSVHVMSIVIFSSLLLSRQSIISLKKSNQICFINTLISDPNTGYKPSESKTAA